MKTYKPKILMLTLFALWLAQFGISSGYAFTLNEAQKLLASDGAAGDFFGDGVSISGNTAVIGSRFDERTTGAAYVYVRDNAGVWGEQQKLTASDGVAGDRFGVAVSISGESIVVGAIDEGDNSSGSAYVFVRNGAGVWSEQQKLTASDAAQRDLFGGPNSVSIDGDTVVIGARGDDDNGSDSGSAYVFVRIGTAWNEQQKLIASDGAAGDIFGWSVTNSGDTAVIAAWQDDGSTGSAYVFVRDGAGAWSEQQKLTASDAAVGDRFGFPVSISADTVVIGAQGDDDNGNGSGSAYVFVLDGLGFWSEQQKLTASDGAAGDSFSESVSISGDTALIGARRNNDNGNDSGSAYIYVRDGTVWSEQQKLTASDAAAEDRFGIAVAISGDIAVIGAGGDDDNGRTAGSAYVFEAGNSLVMVDKLINHRVRPTADTAAQLLVGTRYRAEYKVTNNSPNRLYRVRVFEGGQLVCNLYDLMPGQSKQPASCANSRNVLAGLNNVAANVSAKVSGSNQALAGHTNAYYVGFGDVPGKLSVAHFVNNKNADTQGSAALVTGNQADITFRVENTGSIKLYRVKTYHDPVSPVDSGWQQQCFFGTIDPGQVRYCKRTINLNHDGLNKAFGRAQGENSNVNPTGFVNASNPSYFNVVLP